ncbi:hypothetical protein [Escherichia phage ZCEC13]|uniref:Uncharacterized protein n=1 Tax=Escherichia phage ZCEC13 TaxID=2935866 RepID=A0AAE9HDC9_9CAUD|nr:hypothetical protein [Escherichia phage ZCEC13]
MLLLIRQSLPPSKTQRGICLHAFFQSPFCSNLKNVDPLHLVGPMLYGQNDAIPTCCTGFSFTGIFSRTHSSDFCASLSFRRSHCFSVSRIPFVTGLPSMRVIPRQMVQIPLPSRYAVVRLPSFSFRNWLNRSVCVTTPPPNANTARSAVICLLKGFFILLHSLYN